LSSSTAAYGLRFTGDVQGLETLPEAGPRWPAVRLEQVAGPAAGELHVGEYEATLPVPGACLRLDRRRSLAAIVAPAPLSPDRLLHPTLGYIATTFSHWLDRLAFHGGAFSVGDGAVALLGSRGDGKSSTLAWLARAGCLPLADDVVVLDGLTAFAGPRSIDLWPDAARALGLPEGVRSVRGGQRQRLAPPAAPGELPLRAWVSLAWGEGPRLRPLSPAERYAALARHLHVQRAGRLAGEESLLDLLALPAFELTRPRGLDSLAGSGSALLELAGQLQQDRGRDHQKSGADGGSG